MTMLRQDLRSALRLARRKPGAVAVIVLAVALGTGACTAMLCLIWALALRPLPFADPEGIQAIQSIPAVPDESITLRLSYADYTDLRAQSRTLTDVAAYLDHFGWTLTSGGGEPEHVNGVLVSERLLPLLGVEPILGRPIREEETRRGADPVVLLGYDLWRRRFGGDHAIVGKTVEANFVPYRIVGVMPPGFAFPGGNEAWISMGFQVPRPTRERILRRWVVMARLRPGVDPDRARQDTAAIGRRLAALHPEDAGRRLEVSPFRRVAIGDDLRQSGLAVLAAVVSVLLIACANITDLLLAHTVERRREIAVRAALGATPRRIIRQLLTESLLFALLGGALGLALGAAGVHFLRGLLPPLPYGFELTVDAAPLAASLAVAVAAGFLFGTAPALQASRADLTEAFHDGGRVPGRPGRLHAGLVVAEVALSAVLLLSASLAIRSLATLRSETAGMVPQHLLTVWVQLAGDHYGDEEVRARTLRTIVERLRARPGIDAAAAANFVPLAANNGTLMRITEAEGVVPGGERAALCTAVSSGFFRTAGMPLLAGRDLTAAETSAHSSAAVVSSSFVRSLWPDAQIAGHAVGRRFHLADPAMPDWLTVVGVAGDLKMESLREGDRPQVYVSAAYNLYRPAALLVRTRMPREESLATVRQTVHALDPRIGIFMEATMDEVRSAALHVERLSSGGLALFGAAALFFAAVGTYGILAGAVVRRRKEIALRLALGAPRGVLLRRLIGRGMALALAGLALGLLAGLAVCRALAGNLYGVTPTDPVSYAGVAILLLDVAFIACWLPARKALEIEPAEVLREG